MAYISKLLIVATTTLAVANSQTLGNGCPANETLVNNNKCCPGYITSGPDNQSGNYCCVLTNGNNFDVFQIPPKSECLGLVNTEDSNFDQEVSDAQSGSGSGSSSSSGSGMPSSSMSTTSPASTTTSSSEGGTTTAPTTSNSSNSPTGTSGAAGVGVPILGMTIALLATGTGAWLTF